jgi:hypothetical protein
MRQCCHDRCADRWIVTPLYIGRGVGLQRRWSTLHIGFLVSHNRSILSYHNYDGGWYVMISKLMVVPNPCGLHPRTSSTDGPDTWSVRVPWAHIFDCSPIVFNNGLVELYNPSGVVDPVGFSYHGSWWALLRCRDILNTIRGSRVSGQLLALHSLVVMPSLVSRVILGGRLPSIWTHYLCIIESYKE